MKSDDELTQAIVRMVQALGRRCAMSDPDSAVYLRMIERATADAMAQAVAGWRSVDFSDAQIGRELGVTKQAVQQRFPRARAAA